MAELRDLLSVGFQVGLRRTEVGAPTVGNTCTTTAAMTHCACRAKPAGRDAPAINLANACPGFAPISNSPGRAPMSMGRSSNGKRRDASGSGMDPDAIDRVVGKYAGRTRA